MKSQAADRPQPRCRGWLLPALCAAALLVLAGGCGEFNDNPNPGGLTVAYEFSTGSGTSSPQLISALPCVGCEPVPTVVLGAIVITHERVPGAGIQPYSSVDQVTDTNENLLRDDAEQSALYLTPTQLPSVAETVDFGIPPAGSGPWQLVGVGLRNRRQAIADIEDGDVTWFGFIGQFLNGQVAPNQTLEGTLTLNPWCPPDNQAPDSVACGL